MVRRTLTTLGTLGVIAAVASAGAERAGAQAQAPLVTQGKAGNDGKMYRVGGGTRDGASAFPRVEYPQMKPLVPGQVDFKHFHTYEEATEILRMWARQYPDLIELYTVGQSLEGREIWQMTLTNKKTGRHTDKPAMFIEGGRHAGEISGIEATLYFANHLLTNYGTDAAMTKLVNTKTFYVKPLNNPDGSSLYHYTAQTLRSTVRPDDSDNDGLVDEDPAEDLDGDGFIRQMRKFVGAGKGNALVDKADPKGRLMQTVPMGQGDYMMLGSEGIDNDNDGRVNEDGVGGLDLHRNYPENWRPATEESSRGYTQGGAGEYPLSEPETRAVFNFLMRHPHIGIVESLDTSVPMILRGPSTSKSEESVFPEDLVYLKKFDQKGMEITGYPWAGDVFWNYANRGRGGAAPSPDAPGTPLFGHGPDFGYSYYGAIWYGNEIWDGGRLIEADANGDGQSSDLEKLTWLDKNSPNVHFQPWTKTSHPTHGEVEVGGWNPKFWSQNPPPEMLEKWARNEAMFNIYLAQQMAQVKIVSATTKPAADGATELTVVVTNEGLLPTALEMAKRVKIVQEDTVAVEYASTQTVSRASAAPAGPGRGGRAGGAGFGGRGGGAPDPAARRRTAEGIGWLKPGETKTLSWTVRGAGPVTVTVGSTRGGVASQTVEIR
jgi:hypothetical protein